MLLQKGCLLLRILKADRKGVTALEYALMGSLIVVVILSAITGLGTKVATAMNTIKNTLP